MALDHAYIAITLPKGGDLDWDEAWRYIREDITWEQMRETVRTFQEMGGGRYDLASECFDLDPDNPASEDSRSLGRYKVGTTLIQSLGQLIDDMLPLVEDHSATVRVDYDPREWFDNKPGLIANYISGRFFLLAHTGVLEVLGFKVEGTGLSTDPAS